MAFPDFTKRDEQKVMLGYDSEEEAKRAFLAHYDDPRVFGGIIAMPMEEFKVKVLATNDKPKMIKAHISGYRRGDGTYVAPHEDKRPARRVGKLSQHLAAEDARRIVEAFAAGGKIGIAVVESMDALKARGKLGWQAYLRIKEAGAEDDVESLYHAGTVYLFPKNIRNKTQLVDVLLRDGRRCALEAMKGPVLDSLLVSIHASNRRVRDLVKARGQPAEGVAAATLEVLSGMKRESLVRVHGWHDLAQFIRLALRDVAISLRQAGMHTAADYLQWRVGGWTDADVGTLLTRADEMVRGKKLTKRMEIDMKQMLGDFGGSSPVVLFMKSYVRAHTRVVNGKTVKVQSYHTGVIARPKETRHKRDPNTGDLFAEAVYSMPKHEAIEEHEHLVDVLNSPSHADDKEEEKKQGAELAEMKAPADLGAKVTPQVPSGDIEKYIKVAADSIASLRKDDVYRVLFESNRAEYRQAIARYIREKRPDLAGEVDEVMAEDSAKPMAKAILFLKQS
jgi:hypothetical protein